MRYDRARGRLDRHATYIVAAFIAGAARYHAPADLSVWWSAPPDGQPSYPVHRSTWFPDSNGLLDRSLNVTVAAYSTAISLRGRSGYQSKCRSSARAWMRHDRAEKPPARSCSKTARAFAVTGR